MSLWALVVNDDEANVAYPIDEQIEMISVSVARVTLVSKELSFIDVSKRHII